MVDFDACPTAHGALPLGWGQQQPASRRTVDSSSKARPTEPRGKPSPSTRRSSSTSWSATSRRLCDRAHLALGDPRERTDPSLREAVALHQPVHGSHIVTGQCHPHVQPSPHRSTHTDRLGQVLMVLGSMPTARISTAAAANSAACVRGRATMPLSGTTPIHRSSSAIA
jgi:hypothetical protein